MMRDYKVLEEKTELLLCVCLCVCVCVCVCAQSYLTL